MKKIYLLVLALGLLTSRPASASSDLNTRIIDATNILARRQGSDDPIPAYYFLNARGVAIGTVTKAGLGLGGQLGEGIVVINRGPRGAPVWSAPSAWDLTGGSLGAQIGYTQIRFIVVLNTDYAVRKFTSNGKTRWDATASGTAGDDTATASESNRSLESRSTIIFKESSGLFGGATLGGSSIELNTNVNQVAYGPSIYLRDLLDGRVAPPPGTQRLYSLLAGRH